MIEADTPTGCEGDGAARVDEAKIPEYVYDKLEEGNIDGPAEFDNGELVNEH